MPFVYLLASKPYGTLYIGSTFDLARRVSEHKAKAVPGFTTKYSVDRLVWYEVHETLESALDPRAANQEMEARLEDQPDRTREPALG